MVLLDLRAKAILGQQAENALAKANITSNKNPVPFDVAKPSDWSGLRLGVAAATTRGLNEYDISEVGACIANLIDAESNGCLDEAVPLAAEIIADICRRNSIE